MGIFDGGASLTTGLGFVIDANALKALAPSMKEAKAAERRRTDFILSVIV
eukprot:CAMPEP_0172531962 /NCGR_PEP_ID=MMETSP1067-20121228/5182_1 /TAXON_ID=265564 ORGANISM="Thalassiosira punctigera, Strain Tpunct2005C2" /NCGR_SAMPLE_ID=MMETSP1067 /ASSEMBLY_ACC=CAM_ASM_000444 /LENGTH=49 /DNA_ID=CAMNT_0013316409 /DNA_START=16 /DNA_END=165 /DNA_ORIENTATION=-